MTLNEFLVVRTFHQIGVLVLTQGCLETEVCVVTQFKAKELKLC